MSIILAIDTSNAYCSVAVNCHGEIATRRSSDVRQHARQLLPMIQELLIEQALSITDLDAVAFVSGPGSFTGLRIGTGVAQGLAFAAGLPVLPVSSLAVMAARALQGSAVERAFVSLLAREGEIYAALYRREDGDVQLEGEESVGPVSAFLSRLQAQESGSCLVGDVALIEDAAQQAGLALPQMVRVPDCPSDAAVLSQLAVVRLAHGMAVEPHQAQPVYVKDQMDYRE